MNNPDPQTDRYFSDAGQTFYRYFGILQGFSGVKAGKVGISLRGDKASTLQLQRIIHRAQRAAVGRKNVMDAKEPRIDTDFFFRLGLDPAI